MSAAKRKRISRPVTAEPDVFGLNSESPVLSRERVCEITPLSMRTLDRAIARGEIASVKRGHRRLIPREALRQWLATGLQA